MLMRAVRTFLPSAGFVHWLTAIARPCSLGSRCLRACWRIILRRCHGRCNLLSVTYSLKSGYRTPMKYPLAKGLCAHRSLELERRLKILPAALLVDAHGLEERHQAATGVCDDED